MDGDAKKSLGARLVAYLGGSAWLATVYLAAAVMLGLYLAPMLRSAWMVLFSAGREIAPWSAADIIVRIAAMALGFCGMGAVVWYRNQIMVRLAQYEKDQLREAEAERARRRKK